MSKMILNASTYRPSPTEIASLLKSLQEFPDVKFDLTVSCDSGQQAGQINRRVKEQLKKLGLNPEEMFNFDGAGSSIVEVSPFESGYAQHDLPDEEDVPEPPETLSGPSFQPPLSSSGPKVVEPQNGSSAPSQAPFHPSASPDNGNALVPEGDFKITALKCDKQGKDGRGYALYTWEISEGKLRGATFGDKVVVWPHTEARAQHFARAVGLAPQELAQNPDAVVGVTIWVRRREVIRSDGNSMTVNYYYPSEWTPPPQWATGS